MIRSVWGLMKILAVLFLIVLAIGKLPSRQTTSCTATVTAADGTVQQVPC